MVMGDPNLTSTSTTYLACPDCDALFTLPETAEGERVVCPRCAAHLLTDRRNFVSRAAALVVAAAFFFLLANLFPVLTLKADYRESPMLLVGSVTGLERQGFPILAGMVGLFVLVAPAMLLGTMLYVLVPLVRGRRLTYALHLCHAMREARRWNMMEVYLLGVLVSLLKLGKLATLTLGVSFWAYVGLIICLAAAVSLVDPPELWKKLEEAT
jgi:paraquat-inducible protein A